MREIKFRALIDLQVTKVMIYNISIHSASNLVGCDVEAFQEALEETDWKLEDDSLINKKDGTSKDIYNLGVLDNGEDYFFFEKFELMQFTGLVDKNKKEIYESDIVSAWSQGYNHKGEIRWRLSGQPMIIIYPAFANQGFWGLHGSERKEGDILIDVTGKLEFTKGQETIIIDDGVEVIGNIHENQEILAHAAGN